MFVNLHGMRLDSIGVIEVVEAVADEISEVEKKRDLYLLFAFALRFYGALAAIGDWAGFARYVRLFCGAVGQYESWLDSLVARAKKREVLDNQAVLAGLMCLPDSDAVTLRYEREKLRNPDMLSNDSDDRNEFHRRLRLLSKRALKSVYHYLGLT